MRSWKPTSLLLAGLIALAACTSNCRHIERADRARIDRPGIRVHGPHVARRLQQRGHGDVDITALPPTCGPTSTICSASTSSSPSRRRAPRSAADRRVRRLRRPAQHERHRHRRHDRLRLRQEAEDAFNAIWSAHNGFFVDYTTGVATKDKAMQDKAVEDLTDDLRPGLRGLHRRRDRACRRTRSPSSSPTTCSRPRRSSTPRPRVTGPPPTPAIRDRLRPHADDRRRARARHRRAVPGQARRRSANKRRSTSASRSTSSSRSTCTSPRSRPMPPSAAGGRVRGRRRRAEHQRHRRRRGDRHLYGDDAEDAFNTIWSAHNGFFVDYTTGVATEDQASRTRPSRT